MRCWVDWRSGSSSTSYEDDYENQQRGKATMTDTQSWITAISVAVIAAIQLVQFLLTRR